MGIEYLMLKDTPVMEINNYTCNILHYDLLPIGLRYKDVCYDDVMHSWLESRNMSLGKSNAKKLMAAFGIPQGNQFQIARRFHFASMIDSYWIKEEGEDISWKDINFRTNPINELVPNISLYGNSIRLSEEQKIHSPEFTTGGVAAKAWIVTKQGIYLYKVGRKEIAASAILDCLGFSHVPYESCTLQEMDAYTTIERQKKISEQGEMVVKSPLIASEDLSLVSWEDFAIYCDRNNRNPYTEVMGNDSRAFHEMIVADYILGNDDRHGCNYGFYMDNQTGKLLRLYPLMDHDNAFSNDTLYTQTLDHDMPMAEAVKMSLRQFKVEFSAMLSMEKPNSLTMEEWDGVIERAKYCDSVGRDLIA